MHYRVSRFASLVPLLFGLASTGCGEVQSGVCAGEQVDDIACTVDICDGEAKAWAHIPNDDLCEAGQRCDPTAGCVAAGALSGVATLLGHTDHSGITVTVAGIEGATAMTDAMGKWSIVIAPGTYKVSYSKDKYFGQDSPEIIVLAEASEVAPSVELAHGEKLADDREITGGYGTQMNPDKSYLIEGINLAFGTAYYATPTDGSKGPTIITTNPSGIQYTNTHAVWTQGGQVFSRPLSGATEAVRLTANVTGTSFAVLGTPGTYTVIRRTRPAAGYTELTLHIARTDGSMLAGAALWTTPDSTHQLGSLVTNDTTALFVVSNSSANPPADAPANTPLYRMNLSTGTVTAVNMGFATNNGSIQSVSPDGTKVVGYLCQNQSTGYQWCRGFYGPLTTGVPNIAPNPGVAPSSHVYQDYAASIDGWMADNSVVYRTNYWYNGSTGVYAGGELKVWTGTSSPATLDQANPAYYYSSLSTYVLNNAVAWLGYPDRYLKVAPTTATPTVTTLDSTQTVAGIYTKTSTGTAASYLAWTQQPGGTSYPNKIYGVNLTPNFAAAPTVVQLGATLPATCQFEGILSNTTFFQLCADTQTLTAYPAASATASGTHAGVQGSLGALKDADRVGFRKMDGNIYTASNAGTLGADVKPVMTKGDFATNIINVGSWVLYRDSVRNLTRISKADGSVADEPLFDCDGSTGQVWIDPGATRLFISSARCNNISYGMLHAPVTNLP